MINTIKDFAKKVVNKLFNKEDIKQATGIEVDMSMEMQSKINLWAQMYRDKAPWIDNDKMFSLNLPSAIASEFARLTTLEMKTEITGSPRADYLNDSYKKFIKNIRNDVEFACAKGAVVFKPYLSGDRLAIDTFQADAIYPIEFDSSGDLVACIFIETQSIGKKIYTKLEYHRFKGNQYIIKNKLYEKDLQSQSLGKEVSLRAVSRYEDIEPEVIIENLDRPLFSYFKIPLANNIDGSDVGVCVFSKAENLIKKTDEQYSRILWEFEGSELAIDADITTIKDGELPANKERLFRRLDIQKKDGDLYSVFSPQIRDSSLFNGLNKLLQRIEFNCGLAYGTLSDAQETAKTATEILSSKQRSYATVSDIQKALEDALIGLVESMDALVSLYDLAPVGEIETKFEWDDSLIVDSGTDQAIMMQEVAAGLIKPEIYLMRRYGVTEEQAKDMLPSVDAPPDIDDVEVE